MAKIQENVVVPTNDADSVKAHQPIHASHITTQSFLRPSPVFAFELFPNRKIDMSVNSFARLSPMPRPVLSRAKVYNRAFFVPYRSVFRDFTQLVVSTPVSSLEAPLYVPQNVPFMTNSAMVHLLMDNAGIQSGTPAAYDFNVSGSTLSSYPDGRYNLNETGQFIYKVLRSLGYNPVFRLTSDFSVSALPLLCYIKVILDWYYPSQYAYSSEFAYWEALFSSQNLYQGMPNDFYAHLKDFFRYIAFCTYEPDYFISSWDNPVGPNSTQFEAQVTIPDVTAPPLGSTSRPFVTNTGSNSTANNGSPIAINSDTGATSTPIRQFTQYTLDALRSLTDWTKAHSLVGVRAVDRYLADFGINLQSELLKRSYYIGYNSFEVNFYDVMSHADTDEAALGDFAGKAFANGSKKFNFSADEFGFFIVINSVVPLVTAYQGTSRHVFHLSQLDFYNGRFDHLGVQPIRKCEVYVPKNGAAAINGNGNDLATQVFSFIPRYAEYHTILDMVTGRFELGSQNLDLRGFFQGRDLSYYDTTAVGDFKHDLNFVLGQDYAIYNDIFYDRRTFESILMAHDFKVQFIDSSKPVWQTYDFENVVKTVKENIGGSTVN